MIITVPSYIHEWVEMGLVMGRMDGAMAAHLKKSDAVRMAPSFGPI